MKHIYFEHVWSQRLDVAVVDHFAQAFQYYVNFFNTTIYKLYRIITFCFMYNFVMENDWKTQLEAILNFECCENFNDKHNLSSK